MNYKEKSKNEFPNTKTRKIILPKTPLALMIEARFMFKMSFTVKKTKNNLKTLTKGSKTDTHASLRSKSKKKFYFYSPNVHNTF